MAEKQKTDELSVLLEGAGFEPDFAEKAEVIFEAKLNERIAAKTEELETLSEQWVEEALAEKVEELEDKLDGYLAYVAENFMEENKLAIEAGQKVEAAEYVLEGLAELMEEQHLSVPEGSESIVEDLEAKITAADEKLDDKITENVELRAEVADLKREIILDTLSEGLSDQQTEKLEELTEDFSIDDEKTFISKVKTIRESYFKDAKMLDEGVIIPEGDKTPADDVIPDHMAAIVAHLGRAA